MLSVIAAVSFVVVLSVLAVFQVALACGAPWGAFAWGGGRRVLPARLRIASGMSLLLYAVFALVILDRADVIDILDDSVTRVAAWFIVGFMALGVAANSASRSKPERYVMTPVSLALTVTSLLVALG
ncbi:hypothetical protein FOH10_14715 [Nocardia otitidiscaviarum]|uniref:Uncharacterized protein n=1 Tax=Nocardia otitidiscaviarum TaxID=1823 RepID=A0A516NX64_9NOCA|nr:hypothetical protein FOH10_14715 [Nocardia otitidiscaviarum]